MIFDKYFEKVQSHHNLFMEIKKHEQELDNYSNLYTNVQKSILNKYKEKTPPSLNNLDFLLSDVHNSIIEYTENYEEVFKTFKLTFKDIIVWTEGMLLFLKLKAKLSDSQFNIVRDVFPLDNLQNLSTNSWVDITLANMQNFFRFYFSKQNDLIEIKDTVDLDKWKKFFKSMCEKIIKKEGF